MSQKQIDRLQLYKPNDEFEYIWGFFGEHRPLSNFELAAITMPDGITYPSNEHAYQAAKTLDLSIRRLVAKLETPGKARRFGMKLDLRPDWEEVRVPVMELASQTKYSTYAYFYDLLHSTDGKILVEANWWG